MLLSPLLTSLVNNLFFSSILICINNAEMHSLLLFLADYFLNSEYLNIKNNINL